MTTAGHPGRVEGYERFFGLKEPPFSLAPNPRFLFESASHTAALAQVAYAIERREPLVVITGEIGTGKTLLCRTVLQRLERKTFVSIVNDPMLERDELLKQVLQDFGVISKDRTKMTTPTSRHDLIHALQEFLASLIPLHAHAVLIIDEAQHLQPDVLEQIRLLSNVDDEQGTLLQIILVGQTDLEPLLSRPELRQFQQRVSRRFRIAPLNEQELKEYIDHRLTVARGGSAPAEATAGMTFTPDALQTLSNLSGGIPRVINILCDRALEAAHSQWLRTIDARLIGATASTLSMPVAGAVWATETMPPTAGERAGSPRSEVEPDVARTDSDRPGQGAGGFLSSPARAENVEPADMFGTAAFQHEAPPAVRSISRMGLVLAGSLVLVAAAIWFGLRGLNPAPETPAPTEAAAPAAAPPAATPPPATNNPAAAPGGAAGAAAPASTTPGSAAPASAAPASARGTAPNAPAVPGAGATPAAAGAGAGQRFEIVVASFRTEPRAATVAAEVTSLGLPIRRRVADGWQQVLTGPFASREEADRARLRLEGAGLTGTQIVPTNR